MNTFARVDKATFYKVVARSRNRRLEFVEGRIVQQQSGGTLRHVHIGRRLSLVIEAQLDPARWLVNSGSDRGVETIRTIRYPDIVVEPVGAADDSLSTAEPALIIEVLSPSSVLDDLDVKPAEYLSLASLQSYIVASQDEPAVQVWIRGADGTFPDDPAVIEGIAALIAVPTLGLIIPLAKVYSVFGSRSAS